MNTCDVTGTVYRRDGVTPRAGVRVSATSVKKHGELFSNDGHSATTGADGKFTLRLPRLSLVRFKSDVVEALQGNGVERPIPDAATVRLADLLPAFSVTVGGVRAGDITALQAADSLRVLELDSSATLAASDFAGSLRVLILADTSAGDVTVTLPPAADIPDMEVTVKKTADGNLAVVDGHGSELIDGARAFNLEMKNEFIRLSAGAGALWIVGKG